MEKSAIAAEVQFVSAIPGQFWLQQRNQGWGWERLTCEGNIFIPGHQEISPNKRSAGPPHPSESAVHMLWLPRFIATWKQFLVARNFFVVSESHNMSSAVVVESISPIYSVMLRYSQYVTETTAAGYGSIKAAIECIALCPKLKFTKKKILSWKSSLIFHYWMKVLYLDLWPL